MASTEKNAQEPTVIVMQQPAQTPAPQSQNVPIAQAQPTNQMEQTMRIIGSHVRAIGLTAAALILVGCVAWWAMKSPAAEKKEKDEPAIKKTDKIEHDDRQAVQPVQQIAYQPIAYQQPAVQQPVNVQPVVNAGQTMSLTIVSGVKTNTGLVLLNTMADHNAAGNFTVVLSGAAATGREPSQFIGRTVSFTGTPAVYKGKNELKVTDPNGIR